MVATVLLHTVLPAALLVSIVVEEHATGGADAVAALVFEIAAGMAALAAVSAGLLLVGALLLALLAPTTR